MNLKTLFQLQWKSTVRHPVLEQGLIMRLLLVFYVGMGLYLLLVLGFVLDQLYFLIYPNTSSSAINIVVQCSIAFCLIDFVLKLILKKQKTGFASLRYLPNSDRSVFAHQILTEGFSLWNTYALVLFAPFLVQKIYPGTGLLSTILLVLLVFCMQMFVSLWLRYISLSNKHKTLLLLLPVMIFALMYGNYTALFEITSWQVYVLLLVLVGMNAFLCYQNHQLAKYPANLPQQTGPTKAHRFINTHGIVGSYVLLSLRMTWRSPALRHQLFAYLGITLMFFFILFYKEHLPPSPFAIAFVFPVILLTTSTFGFNQYLIVAEASFFDKLMTMPNAVQLLQGRYLQYVSCSLLILVAMLFCTPVSVWAYFELFSVFVYSIGPVSLLSFTSMFFATSRFDLFAPFAKRLASQATGQSFITLFIYTISMSPVMVLYWLCSAQMVTYILFISGILSIIYSRTWLEWLFKYFCFNKYEKMELFRQ